MSQNVKVYRTLEFYAQGGATKMSTIDTDESATICYWLPETNDTGALYFGNGTKDMDVRFYTGSGVYASFDVGADTFNLVGVSMASNKPIAISDTTTSTSTTTGSLRTAGGLGVAGTAFFGGLVTSNSTTGFRSLPTFVPDSTYTNYAFSVGNKVAELAVNFDNADDQNFNPIQAIVNCTATSTGPTNSSQTNLFFAQLTHDTNAMANLRLKCADFTTIVGVNVLDAYAYQGEVKITGDCAIGGQVCALGLVVNAGTGTVTGSVVGQTIAMDGLSMPVASYGLFMATGSSATLTHAIYIETQNGTTITNGISLANASAGTFTNLISAGGTIVNFLNLATAGNSGFVTTGGTDCTASGTTDPAYTLKIINPAGGAGYIRVWAAA